MTYTKGAKRRAKRQRLQEVAVCEVSGVTVSPPRKRAGQPGRAPPPAPGWRDAIEDRCRALGLKHTEANATRLRQGGTALDVWAIRQQEAGGDAEAVARCLSAGKQIWRSRAMCAAYGLPPYHPRQPGAAGPTRETDHERARAAWLRWCEVHDAIRALPERWEVEFVCLEELPARDADALRRGLEAMAEFFGEGA